MKYRILASIAALFIAFTGPVMAQKSAGEHVDDSTINASVKAALIENKKTHAGSINVETYRGVVELSGFAASEDEKLEAGKTAAGVAGVKEVRNRIALQDSTSMGQKIDDSVTTGRVKAALIDAKDVKSGQINVETRGGVVQLSGFVTSDAMRDRAVRVAQNVDGVKRVDDAMLVKPQ